MLRGYSLGLMDHQNRTVHMRQKVSNGRMQRVALTIMAKESKCVLANGMMR